MNWYKKAQNIDTLYLDAKNKKDINALQKMTDEKAISAGYNTIPMWHGSSEPLTVIRSWEPIYLAFDESLAKNRQSANVHRLYTKINTIFDTKTNLKDRQQFLSFFKSYHGTIRGALINGLPMYDFAVEHASCFRGTDAMLLAEPDIAGKDQRSIVVWSPRGLIKSADPITYDDSGKIIPLSKRFQKTNPDIRY